ncbi:MULTISPECIES: ATP-binding cassette domain-containing protein [Pseudoalteromonas]|uniref:ABC transporter ATP-binding protein n=1 Tax=Pseudoalteromonas maricaloris TaxID=184924 RepID=A0A8I2H023_9GAMM|nr:MULTISPECIES: ABC transporter ATP-binding protein [Pseudoalteromonas]KID32957.1 peptide ABC transporter ATP-binding protein [Pseudoalteromonas flavipulchra NCIMB 2033 = ATCC BAA-314]MBD0781117.1 ABC transporter ATP-binding protein [Pseudoalteromonas flavipulchra]MBE0373523.1 dipeptide transport system ATP-binding protein [Pseudoalteromonas flavipulchra NCIMB 2033 = ATCC BAA-314]NLR19960.1 ABC transporter ATP-binding protein [Pseudoalteromonas maricaloris]PHI38053.1 ABC transporter ATP-bindi
MQPVLKVQSLNKSYTSRQGLFRRRSLQVLRDVSFALAPGQTLAIIGETGSGKSTLAKVLAGADMADSGQILLNGQIVEDAGIRNHDCRTIRLIFQDPTRSLNPGLTIGDMLDDCLQYNTELTEEQRYKKIRITLSRVGLLGEHIDYYPHMFSGGQLQRVALARALILDPKVLVLDEALSSLDPSVRAQTVNLLLELQAATGLAYVLITHHLSLVRHMSDEILVLNRGKVVEYGETECVFNTPKSKTMQKLLSA